MGRLGRSRSGSSGRPFLRVHYRKLAEDYSAGVDSVGPLPDYFSYCCCRCGHTQKVKAEELNSIVGNAFRMAYAAQLQRQPTFQDMISSQLSEQGSKVGGMSVALRLGGGKDPPRSIPGLRPHVGGDSNHSTPSSDESNSPTELNSYKRLTEKPPLVKRLAMGLTNNERTEELRPLVSRPLSGGYVNEAVADPEGRHCNKLKDVDATRLSQSCVEPEMKVKRISQISSSSGGTIVPPPPPARVDSLTGRAEEGELRGAPWFQAGIPREITLEVLSREPVGAFMVRESTSKSGCYALSLRVPRDFQPTGIAHYLILRTLKGYKIKGFTKEFTSLTALITHHSVMPELLPCPLNLSRFNTTFTQPDPARDFSDLDSDPDYDTLADFRRMMADLNV